MSHVACAPCYRRRQTPTTVTSLTPLTLCVGRPVIRSNLSGQKHRIHHKVWHVTLAFVHSSKQKTYSRFRLCVSTGDEVLAVAVSMTVCGLCIMKSRRQFLVNAHHCHFDNVGRRPLHRCVDCLSLGLLNNNITIEQLSSTLQHCTNKNHYKKALTQGRTGHLAQWTPQTTSNCKLCRCCIYIYI